ncbi:unnamed protein product, partial [Mesorhabditis belari]|uniref:Major facilitator superfamily (MFS) profile domain-containing protein n=1 Tax=Mesorhabditis belari TaxID=2138241 RepID=A0AAF3EJM3_9BILA
MAFPYIAKDLQIADTHIGYIATLFGLLQVLGGPVFGHITQKYGVRVALYFCYGSTLVSALIMYNVNGLYGMYFSRLPVFFMHGQQGHQTLLSLLTAPGKERTNAFGRMGLTFGISFILTPVITLSSTYIFGSRGAMLTIAMLGVLPFVIFEMCLQRKDYDHSDPSSTSTKALAAPVNWSSAVRVLKKPGTLNILFKKNAPITPALMTFSILQIYTINAFQATQETSSMIQMFVGACIMFSNGFGVIWLRKHFDEQRILQVGLVSFFFAFFFLIFYVRLWMFCIIMPLTSMGMSLVATVADSLLTSVVEEDEQGVVLGVATSLNSFVRTFSPALSGQLLAVYGFPIFGILGLWGTVLGLIACHFYPVDPNLIRKEKSDEESKKID